MTAAEQAVTRCPAGTVCEMCGATAGLTVREAGSGLGTLCATVCDRCPATGPLPPLPVGTTIRRVLDHATHNPGGLGPVPS
jgi:hypothetical protein